MWYFCLFSLSFSVFLSMPRCIYRRNSFLLLFCFSFARSFTHSPNFRLMVFFCSSSFGGALTSFILYSSKCATAADTDDDASSVTRSFIYTFLRVLFSNNVFGECSCEFAIPMDWDFFPPIHSLFRSSLALRVENAVRFCMVRSLWPVPEGV